MDSCSGDVPDPKGVVVLQVDSERLRFQWGPHWAFGSAAYWVVVSRNRGNVSKRELSIGDNLLEETAACILGGYGISAELGGTAFATVKTHGLLRPGVVTPRHRFEAVLSAPIRLISAEGIQHFVRYRFPCQRAHRLEAATRHFAASEPPTNARELRHWLLEIPGIGYKTASWIVRNHARTDEVAVVDIHIRRAGILAGFFRRDWALPADYLSFEKAFLGFAAKAHVSAVVMDTVMWSEMRTAKLARFM